MNKVFQKVSLNLSLRDTSWGDEGCAITWTFIPVPNSDWKCKSLITLWDKRKSCRKHQGSQTCWACNIITPCISTMFISSSRCLNIFIPSLLHGREISTICRRDSSLAVSKAVWTKEQPASWPVTSSHKRRSFSSPEWNIADFPWMTRNPHVSKLRNIQTTNTTQHKWRENKGPKDDQREKNSQVFVLISFAIKVREM